jgi:hypothetical protein
LPLLDTIILLLPHASSRVRDDPYLEEGIHRNSNLVAKEIMEKYVAYIDIFKKNVETNII